ncbi:MULTISPECIES: glutaminase A [Micrococcus]|uniref:glutaminase A n=1 Tax=Micrococcus TaxID=1269 RepID=UPI000B4E7C43|nr:MULTISPECIES: glutaminase A [Micrococcus]PNL17583.1 glutaminase A [Micrococcus sp. FDAARGOS_333]WIK82459.1 glutaminase A [Micrococcus lylae]
MKTTNPSRVSEQLARLISTVKEDRNGAPSEYLEDVEDRPVDGFAVAVCTTDGVAVSEGDTQQAFALQSVSKALTYAVALQERGMDAVLERVGVEPSGMAFNELSLHSDGRPYNPLINVGAIMTHGLIPGDDEDARLELLLDRYSQLAGTDLTISEDVWDAETARAHQNLGLAHMLAASRMLPDDAHEVVRGYLGQCSVEVTVEQLATMGATLASGGVNPVTGRRVLAEWVCQQVMSVMLSCGMYNASGQWMAEVGIPAKSGVSGALLGAVPGALGIASWSPRLDEQGTSVRGIGVFEALSADWDLHVLRHRDAMAGLREAAGDGS